MGLLITVDYHDPHPPVVALAGTDGRDLIGVLGAGLSHLTADTGIGLIVDLRGLHHRDRPPTAAHLAELTDRPLAFINPEAVGTNGVTVAASRPAALAALRRVTPPHPVGDTVVDVLATLADQGWAADFDPTSGGRIRCGGCGDTVDPNAALVGCVYRFDDDTDPADQRVIFELACEVCGATGTMVCGHGPAAGPDDADVLAALGRRLMGGRIGKAS